MTCDTTSADLSRKLVSDFLRAWEERDIDELMGFFSEDAVYHNVPVAPIVGARNIREIFTSLLEIFDEISIEIIKIASEPDLVFAERIDHFALNGQRFDLPVNGVFELRAGKIIRFSDYFDLASFEGPSGMKLS